jgi:hypothetical protein
VLFRSQGIIGDDGILRCPHCYRCLSLADRAAKQSFPR